MVPRHDANIPSLWCVIAHGTKAWCEYILAMMCHTSWYQGMVRIYPRYDLSYIMVPRYCFSTCCIRPAIKIPRGAVITLLIIYKIPITDTPYMRLLTRWPICLTVWFMFCPSHCSVACNVMLYWTTLKRQPTVSRVLGTFCSTSRLGVWRQALSLARRGFYTASPRSGKIEHLAAIQLKIDIEVRYMN